MVLVDSEGVVVAVVVVVVCVDLAVVDDGGDGDDVDDFVHLAHLDPDLGDISETIKYKNEIFSYIKFHLTTCEFLYKGVY